MTPRFFSCYGAVFLALAALGSGNGRADEASSNAPSAIPARQTSSDHVEKAYSYQADGKLDSAVSEATTALDLDPKNVAALDLRATIYAEEKYYDLAERDYKAAAQISPDATYTYKLGEIKFLQREYDDARPYYATIKDDARLGDIARFKILACDLFGSHDDIAARDLALLDATGKKPSYYYGRAALALTHRDAAQANRLAAQAAGKFDRDLCGLYTAAFSELHPFTVSRATFVTKDGRHFDNARISLENDGLRAFSGGGWVTLPLAQLPDDLSPFPDDIREEIVSRRDVIIPPLADHTNLTFMTRDGKTYRQVRWNLGANSLVILTTDGWLTIPFRDLPDDLSSFPSELQNEIKQARAQPAIAAASAETVSFTTRRGKKYDSVRAYLTDDGVTVLSPDGWTNVPFAELPQNLAPFPEAWQKQIRTHLLAIDGADSSTALVSFTTQSGAVYHEVRASLSSDGIMVVTPEGWKTVAFAELPTDLSPFPSAWCTVIQNALQANSGDAPGVQVVSFATRRGKSYDQVRASLGDDGVDVLSSNGWEIVSYDQLPVDLSAFPASWRATIAAREKQGGKPAASAQP